MKQQRYSEHDERHATNTKQQLQSRYLCSCRLLQWMTERLPIDRRSSAMRGMGLDDWYNACNMLINAGIIDSQLILQMEIPAALKRLRRYRDDELESQCHDGQRNLHRRADASDCLVTSRWASLAVV